MQEYKNYCGRKRGRCNLGITPPCPLSCNAFNNNSISARSPPFKKMFFEVIKYSGLCKITCKEYILLLSIDRLCYLNLRK